MKLFRYFVWGSIFFFSFFLPEKIRAESVSFLAPGSYLFDSEWFDPSTVDAHAELSQGRKGILKLMEMFNSEVGKTVFHDALANKGLKVEFSHYSSPTGAHYLIGDIYPTSAELQKEFSNIILEKLAARRMGDVTDIKEDSLGRVMVLIGKQGESSVPLIWEIQPSTTSRLWQAANKNTEAEELQWRKHVTRALARFYSLMGFKDIYARSAKSIERHPKYTKTGMDITKTQGVKQWIDPRDVAQNYEQTFANSFLWEKAAFVNYELWSDMDRYNEKHFELHRYTQPDIILNEKGIKFYHLFERKTKQGYKLCVGFKNLSTHEIFLFDYEDLLKGLKIPLSSEAETLESITKTLRFKYKVRLFEHIRPDLELKNSLKDACPQSA